MRETIAWQDNHEYKSMSQIIYNILLFGDYIPKEHQPTVPETATVQISSAHQDILLSVLYQPIHVIVRQPVRPTTIVRT